MFGPAFLLINLVVALTCNAQGFSQEGCDERIVESWQRVLSADNKERQMAKFIGFIEGALEVQFPSSLEERLFKIIASEKRVNFLNSEIVQQGVKVPKFDLWIILDEDTCPEQLVERQRNPAVESVGIADSKYLFLFFRSGNSPRGKLFGVDKSSEEIIWAKRSEEKAEDVVVSHGPTNGFIELAMNDNVVIVFRQYGHEIEIISFLKNSGEVQFRALLRDQFDQE